jgi:hypothetical protein
MDKEQIIQWASKVGAERAGSSSFVIFNDELEAFAKLVAAHEREAIEMVVGVAMLGADHELTKRVLGAIRARGNT